MDNLTKSRKSIGTETLKFPQKKNKKKLKIHIFLLPAILFVYTWNHKVK